MSDQYYQLARLWQGLSRQDLAVEIRKFHQQTVDIVGEHAGELAREARESGESMEELERRIRTIELTETQIAHDRTFLRRTEALLYVARSRRAIILPKKDVADAFAAGHGVDVGALNETALEVESHPGKYAGQ
jgi:hypothetical protein